MADIQFKTVDSKKWETLAPPTPAKKEDKYSALLDALEAEEILEIPTTDNKEMKGLRITLGRKSRGRGFVVEYRVDGNTLYVKKSGNAPTPKVPKERKTKVAQEV